MAQPPSAVDDDDTAPNDDVDDDDVAQPPSAVDFDDDSTTTTVTTTTSTSTTSTTMPFLANCWPTALTVTDGPDAPKFGPWEEWQEGVITYRQIEVGAAGIARGRVFAEDNGTVSIFTTTGRSFDRYIISPNGDVERETVDPRGASEISVGQDSNGAFHVGYTDLVAREIRYATNQSGHWVYRTIIRPPFGGIWAQFAFDDDGAMHGVYAGYGYTPLTYLTYRNDLLTLRELAPAEDDIERMGVSIALDGNSRPHLTATHENWLTYWHEDDQRIWHSEELGVGAGAVRLLVDKNDAVHIAYSGTDGYAYYANNTSGEWSFFGVDRCEANAAFLSLDLDSTGAAHLFYDNNYQQDVVHATNAGGQWRVEKLDTPG